MARIITLGELLIDLTQRGTDEHGYGEFVAYPGGAPANVAVATSRLGAEAAFIGKVGDDAFGRSLADTLSKEGVDIQGLYYSEDEPTTMAIVSVDETGERDFSFYRNPGADTQLTAEEAVAAIKKLTGESTGADADSKKNDNNNKKEKSEPETCTEIDFEVAHTGILHIGSLSLTTSPSREATIAAIEYAKSKGMLISYDPNYRAALWDGSDRAVEEMKSLLPYADILKVSDEEMEMLTGTSDLEEGSILLQNMGRDDDEDEVTLIMVTLGSEGVFVRSSFATEKIPGFKVDVADTNGAGDTFLGAMLAQIAGKLHENSGTGTPGNGGAAGNDGTSGNAGAADADISMDISWSELTDMVRYANRAASVTCSRHGAIPAMPFASELQESF